MLQRKNLGEPDEVRTFPRGRLEIVNLPGLLLGRAVLEPGWRWSEHLKPIAGTESCELAHVAYVVSGRMHVKMDDGSEMDLAAGDAHVVSPGHDGWVVGDEPLIAIDIIEANQLASTDSEPGGAAQSIACPCGVSFSVTSAAAVDHLVRAVQEHALGSHGHEVSREHVLAEVQTAPALAATTS